MDSESSSNRELNLAPERPSCVAAYALLLWFAAAIPLLFIGWFLIADPLEFVPADSAITFMATCLLPLVVATGPAILALVTGVGLWRMRRWGVWLLLITLAVVAVLALAVTSLGILTYGGILRESTTWFLLVVTLLANGLVLYWFIKNRLLFNGDPDLDRAGSLEN